MRSKTFKSGSNPKISQKTIGGMGASSRTPHMKSAGLKVGGMGKMPDKAMVKRTGS